MIAENYGYKESINAAAEIVTSGALGNVVTFSLLVSRQFNPSNPYLATTWRQQPAHVGGYLSDGGVHWSALLVATLGPVAAAAAFARQIQPVNGTDDTMALSLRLKSGVVGNWTTTYAAGAPGFANFTVIGTEGSLVMNDLNTITVTNAKAEVVKQLAFEGEDSGPTTSAKTDIVDEFKDFHDTILRKKHAESGEQHVAEAEEHDFVVLHKHHPKVTVEEAYHHFAIVYAAIQSVASKQIENVV